MILHLLWRLLPHSPNYLRLLRERALYLVVHFLLEEHEAILRARWLGFIGVALHSA